jgi:hypothetical protein
MLHQMQNALLPDSLATPVTATGWCFVDKEAGLRQGAIYPVVFLYRLAM